MTIETQPLGIILTGGPGAGKTTTLNHLEAVCKYHVVEEAATAVIRMKLAEGIEAPWDKPEFQQHVLDLQKMRQQKAAALKTDIVFFDRSPVDTLAYQRIKCPDRSRDFLLKEIRRLQANDFYHTTVFVVGVLEKEHKDEIRHENGDEARSLEKEIMKEYQEHGFKVVYLESDTVENRVNRILTTLKEEGIID